jgi:hypothetical protein
MERAFVEDLRRNGGFLRITWHGPERQFVVSNWDGNVCVGATRVAAEEAPRLIGVLVDGLVDAARSPAAEAEPSAPAPLTLRQHLRVWWRERGRRAAVLPLDRIGAASHRRSA